MNKITKEQIKNLNYLMANAQDNAEAKNLALELNKKHPGNSEIQHALISLHIFFDEFDRATDLINHIKSKEKETKFTYYFLSEIFRKKNDKKNRLKYIINSLQIDPTYRVSALSFHDTLIKWKDYKKIPYEEKILSLYEKILDNAVIRISDISNIIQNLLVYKLDELDLINNEKKSKKELIEILKKLKLILSYNVFSKILKKTLITNLRLEIQLVNIKAFLINVYQNNLIAEDDNSEIILFLESLAVQNLIKGNIWLMDNKDRVIIEEFQDEIISKIKSDNNISNFELNIFYSNIKIPEDLIIEKKFYKFLAHKNNDLKDNIDIKIKWKNTFKETKKNNNNHKIKRSIHSKRVEEFYDKNPSPEWNIVRVKNKIPFDQFLKKDIYPMQILGDNKSSYENPKILDIGCGSGRETIFLSAISNSQVDAIDLSLKNLSYSQNKVKQHKIKNINFYHLDLLDLDKLEKNYDFINIDLVLDELEDYQLGMESILRVLNKKGLIRFGIESKIANNIFQVAKKNIFNQIRVDEEITEEEIRIIRNLVRASDKRNIKNLLLSHKFYSKNQFTNLFSPITKPSFDIPLISNLLKNNKLQFLGWANIVNKVEIKKLYFESYKKRFPNDDFFKNLDNWNKLEIQYPRMFFNKYSFWARKI